MSKTLQNFYKSTITLDWTIGTGNFYVSVKPIPTAGWLVISPNNAATREIVAYTNTGTDSNGDYITISARGVGGTSEQTHTIGEPVRMNITAEHWDDMQDDIADIVAAGVTNATTTAMGGVEIATNAEAQAGTDVGGTGAPLSVLPSQVKLLSNYVTPTTQVFNTSTTSLGSPTSQFDITNPAGTTFRYTWDGGGTDPVINATTVPVGTTIAVMILNCTNANNGVFTVTGSGTNYFEVTNASGVAETDKTIGTGGAIKKVNAQTWTKPVGLKYAVIEGVAAGGAGGYSTSDGNTGAGGGAGGYFIKTIVASSLAATETLYVGLGGIGLTVSNDRIPQDGSNTLFGSILTATGGIKGASNDTQALGGLGGTATGGDLNVTGGDGFSGAGTSATFSHGGNGGASFFGGGGYGGVIGANGASGRAYGSGGGGSAAQDTSERRGGDGANGVLKVIEFY